MSSPDPLLCAVLRGEVPAWSGGEAFAEAFLAQAAWHGVAPLLHARLVPERARTAGWPQAVLDALRNEAIACAMWEMRHQQLLTGVLAELDAAGVRPVLFKGTALAYGLYPDPALRSRGDTDLIVAPADRERAAATLERLGFARGHAVSGEYVTYQASYTRVEPGGTEHCLDLHWRISNSELLARLFRHDELLAHARALPQLAPHARAAGRVHALLLACMHRAGHKQSPYTVGGDSHCDGDRLIWFYDLHLLAATFCAADWDEFLAQTEAKDLREVCLEGLTMARDCFGTVLPDTVWVALARPGRRQTVARYMDSPALTRIWLDFRAIDDARGKAHFIRETLFPAASYMRGKYPDGGWLPWLYCRRAFGGVRRRLNR